MNKFWFQETHTEGYEVKWKIRDVLHSEKSKYQDLAIIDTIEWGKALVLDGALQVSEKDEFIYHEMIVHVAMHSHPNPENVLIIGGGDGGTLREVVKHNCLKSVDMVEIDDRVIEVSKQYLPSISSAYNDPRLRLYVEDGIKFVENSKEQYDIVIVDSSDPIGPAIQLFSQAFYRDVFAALDDDGLLTVQSESPLFYQDTFKSVYNNINAVFPAAYVYTAAIPTYVSGLWSFSMGSKDCDPRQIVSDREIINGLKYYNEAIHEAAFSLPPFIKEMLK
jgi:spermidine synthase